MKSGHDIYKTKRISVGSKHVEPSDKSHRYKQIVVGSKSTTNNAMLCCWVTCMEINTPKNILKMYSRRQNISREKKPFNQINFKNETPPGVRVNLIKFLSIVEKLSTFKR